MKHFGYLRKAVRAYGEAHHFTCDICGRETFKTGRVCEPCMRTLPRVGEIYCPFCGRKSLEAGVCMECKRMPLAVEKARAVCTHDGAAARLVVALKRGKRYFARTAAELMLPLLAEFPHADLMISVPMTKRGERRRGYNQSRLLGQELSRLSGIPFSEPVQKTRETISQKLLTRQERESNLAGCFRVRERKAVCGKNLLIVDDTLTTGTTASELARVLKNAGANEVYLLTFTSVQSKNPFDEPKGERG